MSVDKLRPEANLLSRIYLHDCGRLRRRLPMAVEDYLGLLLNLFSDVRAPDIQAACPRNCRHCVGSAATIWAGPRAPRTRQALRKPSGPNRTTARKIEFRIAPQRNSSINVAYYLNVAASCRFGFGARLGSVSVSRSHPGQFHQGV